MRALILASVALGLCVPAFAADPREKLDRYGDPLPAGALMRFGTLRNRAPITGFGIEKDGTVVTVGPGADVRRWRATDDKSSEPIVLPLDRSKLAENEPQVSPDGRYVAACTRDTVFVWETPADAKAKPKQVAAFAHAMAGPLYFSPDGSKLVVACAHDLNSSFVFARPISLCDLKTGKTIDLEGKVVNANSVRFSADGKHVFANADDKFVLWDTATAKRVAEVKISEHSYLDCALNPARDLIVAQQYTGNVKIEWHFFDVKTGKRRNDLLDPGVGASVSFAPDGKTILVAGDAGVLWWDPVAGKVIRKFDGDASGYGFRAAPARFTPDGKTLVATSGHVLFRWDAATGKPLFSEQNAGHSREIASLGISADGKRIATRGQDGRLCVWDASTGAELWRAPADRWTSLQPAFSPDGKFLYAGVPDKNEVMKSDAATGKELLKLIGDAKLPKRGSVEAIRVAADGKTVFAIIGPSDALHNAQVVVWDSSTGERLKTARVFDRECFSSDLSPDGVLIAIGIDPTTVLPVAEQRVNYLVDAKLQSAGTPTFSDDGKWLTVLARTNAPGGGDNHWAVVYSTKTWKQVCSISIVKSGRAALSPDGKTLAVAADENVEFFDTATSKSFGEYKLSGGAWGGRYRGYTQSLRFTPDGTKLITGHADTTALVWAVPERTAK